LAAVGAGAVFLFHVWGALLVATVVATHVAIGLARWARGRERVPVSQLYATLAVFAGVAIPWIVWQWMVRRSAPQPSPEFRGWSAKVSALASPFGGVPPWLPASLGIGYFGSLIAFVVAYRRQLRWDLWIASAVACVALYLVFPVGRGMAWDIDARWMLPALVLPFCMSATCGSGAVTDDGIVRAGTPRRTILQPATRADWALLVPFVACVVHAGVVWQVAVRPIDRRLDDYDAVLARIPSGRAVLALVADRNRFGGFVNPYRHYALWRVARDAGPVGGMFAADFLADVTERRPRYTPSQRWGISEFGPLDWERIGVDYDYIVVAGDDPRALSLVGAGARGLGKVGDITLFRVATWNRR
jgi:hypothetical protein